MAAGDFHSTEKIAPVTIAEWEEHGHVGGTESGPAFKFTQEPPVTMRIDAADSTTTYIGEAIVGSVTSGAIWRIKKIVASGSLTSILFADGNQNYDNVWDNRASLSYS